MTNASKLAGATSPAPPAQSPWAWLLHFLPGLFPLAALAVFLHDETQASLLPLCLLVAGMVLGTLALVLAQRLRSGDDLRAARARDPERLADLEADVELRHGVFEVAAELVGCTQLADARLRFAAALGRWWQGGEVELWLWERGAWRLAAGPVATGPGEPARQPPLLEHPVLLPDDRVDDLVLDLSAGVEGQAAVVLPRARPQPSLAGHAMQRHRAVAELLRGPFALVLRRVALHHGLQALARSDPLTATFRRWYGEIRLRELVDAGQIVAVALIDLDRFKAINDGLGHQAGDVVLAAVGRCLASRLRPGDLVCRFGGEEFLVILPHTNQAGGLLVAERLRSAVAELHGLPAAVTISVGLAACWQDDTADALLARADAALLSAKSAGRNRCQVADDRGGVLRSAPRPRSSGDSAIRRLSTALAVTADRLVDLPAARQLGAQATSSDAEPHP